MTKQVFVKITGLVQGVFFRAETRKTAENLKLAGWVRNTNDGGVEILAQGEEGVLGEFLKWCKKGAAGARVDNVDVKWQNTLDDLSGFSVKY